MKLISVNIEGDKHIDLVLKFIKEVSPDIICVQEIFLDDFELLKHTFGYEGVFVPMAYKSSFCIPQRFQNKLFGIAILTRSILVNIHTKYYIGDSSSIPFFRNSEDLAISPHILNHLILGVEIMHDQKNYTIFTTHLPVTPKGLPTEYQMHSVTRLIEFLNTQKSFILCGDLNAPRGGEAFTRFSEVYHDNIPLEYKTSLDQNLHRVKGLQYMVDGLFSTSEYKCENVFLRDGVSDHMAIVADIEKYKL